MAIVHSSEFQHPLLGRVWYDDGKRDPTIAGSLEHPQQWICRPRGWEESGMEIYLPGDASAPANLEAGLEALRHAAEIDAAGRRLADGNVELGWIDLTANPPSVGFPDLDHIYVLWTGKLDSDWKIRNLTFGN